MCQILHKSLSNPKIFSFAFNILNLIARNFFGSIKIAENDEIMEKILEIMKSKVDMEDTCLEILQTMSENPSGINKRI